MKPESVKLLRDTIQISDEDLARLSPGIQGLLDSMEERAKYKIVAEAVSSNYCMRKVLEGQKYVFVKGELDPQETTAPFCLGALAPLAPVMRMISDRFATGAPDLNPVFNTTECTDMGIDNGGLGKVKFRVTVEKMA